MTIIRVLDFETTGTTPPEAQVCEVGICDVHLEDRHVEPPVSWLCGVPAMPPEARAVHHISLSDCARFAPFDQAMIFERPCDAIAAHNAAFECLFIEQPKLVMCTYKSALRVWPDAPGHSNGVLQYWLEDQGLISYERDMAYPPHRAGPDAYVTAHILLALFNAGARGRDMVAWTREPCLYPTCPLGKFRGKPWVQVEEGFLRWMIRTPDIEEDLKWNARRELSRRAEPDRWAN